MRMQSILAVLYPAQCAGCGSVVEGEGALCPDCWRDTPFVRGSVCVKCGAPLPGEAPGDDLAECDDCMLSPRPWTTGASVFVYDGIARRLVLALKHGDRQDLVKPLAMWMAARLHQPPGPDDVVVPVPIHWRRLFKRRFNQSALLAQRISRLSGAVFLPDALVRLRHTPPQEGLTIEQRFALQAGTIAPHPTRGRRLTGRRALIVDDVMTSGATLAAAAAAAKSAGAARIDTVTIARVVRDF